MIVLLVIVYVGLYVILSVPAVQNRVKKKVCDETSVFLGGRLEIETLNILPFSEIILNNVSLQSPNGQKCGKIGKVAAGIDLWKLIIERKIVVNYAEIISFDVNIVQNTEGGPLNIKFLIDALSPKDKDKPSAIFDLRIRNIVVRDSKANFSRIWMTDSFGKKLPFADVNVSRLRIDLSIPVLKNDQYRFDIRNLQFEVSPGIAMRGLTAEVEYQKKEEKEGGDRVSIKDFKMEFPNSTLSLGDVDLNLGHIDNVRANLTGSITPSDFSSFLPQLSVFNTSWDLNIDALYKDNGLEVNDFFLNNKVSDDSSIKFFGNIFNLNKKDSIDLNVIKLNANLSSQLISSVLSNLTDVSDKGKKIIEMTERVKIDLEGNLRKGNEADTKGKITTDIGNIEFDASGSKLRSMRPTLSLQGQATDIEFDKLLATDKIGKSSFDIDAAISGLDRNADGYLLLISNECHVMGNLFSEVELDFKKSKDDIDVNLVVNSDKIDIDFDAIAHLAGKNTKIQADMSLSGFNPSDYGIRGKMSECELSGNISASTLGNSIDNVIGMLELSDLSIVRPNGNKLNLKDLKVNIDSIKTKTVEGISLLQRDITLTSDWINARIEGDIYPSTLGKEFKRMIGKVFPTFASNTLINEVFAANNDFTFDVSIKGISTPYSFFDTPVSPLTDIPIRGAVDMKQGKLSLNINTPHLQQGKNKLIRDLDFLLDIDSFLGMAKIKTGLIFPAKKGDVELAADIYAFNDKLNINVGFNPTMQSVLKGGMAMDASFSRLADPYNSDGALAIRVGILPSSISISDKTWSIANGTIDYTGKRIDVDNFI
ncbi:MAG: hypothetical protein K2G77_00985, partial [Muribaculaceae bacterium]|nr:hypothetical protein [Muribaculaceae bacterium]